MKSPSVFLKKITFVRDYEIRGGVAYPTRIVSNVETRLVGPAEMNVRYSNHAREDAEQARALAEDNRP